MIARITKIIKILLIFIPPFLLTPLIFMQSDIGSAILWFPAMIAQFISFFTILKYITLKFILKKPSVGSAIKLFRPVLTIIIIFIANFSVYSSQIYALNHAKEIAHKMQEDCKRNGFCSIPEIDKDDKWVGRGAGGCLAEYDNCKYVYGPTAQYAIYLTLESDRKEFYVTGKRNIDSALRIKGGVGIELEEKYSDDGSSNVRFEDLHYCGIDITCPAAVGLSNYLFEKGIL